MDKRCVAYISLLILSTLTSHRDYALPIRLQLCLGREVGYSHLRVFGGLNICLSFLQRTYRAHAYYLISSHAYSFYQLL
ncbi:hypothetical protein F4859DRAFT_474115 [Xylaria cf. heliscus]|nr:hypothetical protein F4859DRAFT_474115 [Xylaria cf. heliscus]